MSLGFEQAGFDVVAAVEIDPVHAAVHSFNFPKCSVLCEDVTNVTGAQIRLAAGIGGRRIDIVVGGAPCQGFSLIGHRALDDPRNTLVKHFVRIVRELSASYFVFENVKGLTIGSHRTFLDELISAFQEVGYNVRLPWRILNASRFGVPQDRERLFLIGAKKGLRLPEYPQELTRPSGSPRGSTSLPEGPSVTDAIGDIPNAEEYEVLSTTDEILLPESEWGKASRYARQLRCLSKNAWFFGYRRAWIPMLLTSSLRTEHTETSRRRFATTPFGEVEHISRLFKLPPEGISNTLRAGTDAARGAFTSPRPIHHLYCRLVTVREMARLHGFPDWFRFHVTKWHGARQVGNAVPPPLARAVAMTMMQVLGASPTAPGVNLHLGGHELLWLDMQSASRLWGVDRRIWRQQKARRVAGYVPPLSSDRVTRIAQANTG